MLTDQAMPGDVIVWLSSDSGICKSKVKGVKWQQAANGSVAVYETEEGEIVPFDQVQSVKPDGREKYLASLPKPDKVPRESELLTAMIEDSDMPSDLKTIIHCIVKGDFENLETAHFLLTQKLRASMKASVRAIDS